MRELLRVDLEEGKYTIVQTEDGKTDVTRYGEPWLGSLATTPGGKMILGMAYEIERLRERVAELEGNALAPTLPGRDGSTQMEGT